MATKKPLSDNAFDWIQDTSNKDKQHPSAKKTSPKSKKSKSSSQARQRTIFVKYRKNDGTIVATQEIAGEQAKTVKNPWSNMPNDKEAARIDLAGELLDVELIKIHESYKVDTSSKKSKLVPKSSD